MAGERRWTAAAVGLLVAFAPGAGRGEGASPVADDPTLIALAVALACAEPLSPQGGQLPAGTSGAEIELVTTVRALSLIHISEPTRPY